MDDTESACQLLQKLKVLGVGLQIDDFGTGYSSLSYLHRLPFDILKIDRSFITMIDQDEDGIEIVKTILALAQNLKMSVIAEGVENQRMASSLREMGCAFAQGNHFSEGLDVESAEELLQRTRKPAKAFKFPSAKVVHGFRQTAPRRAYT